MTLYTVPYPAPVAPAGYLVLHGRDTGLRLNDAGDVLRLIDPSGRVVDKVTIPRLRADTSWARSPDGTGAWEVATQPSPGLANRTRVPPRLKRPRPGRQIRLIPTRPSGRSRS